MINITAAATAKRSTIKEIVSLLISDCNDAIENESDMSEEDFICLRRHLKAIAILNKKATKELEALKAREKNLKQVGRRLNKAIENGDPEDIASISVFHLSPLLKSRK